MTHALLYDAREDQPDLTLVDPAAILAMAARLQSGEIPMGDEAWRLTPLGRAATDHINELRFNNYSEKTLSGRQDVLRWLAGGEGLAHLTPGEVTLGDLKAFLAKRWGDTSPNTKATYTSHVRTFFQWLEDNEMITVSPARRLRNPRTGATEKRAYPRDTIRRLVVAQDSEQDRTALLLMYWCALRRNELRQVQFRHLDLTHRILVVFGKGSTVMEQNIDGRFALDLERYILNRQPGPDEFLLHPRHDRMKPFSMRGIDRWFERCRVRACLEHIDMHELRHSAGTHFHQEGHDLVATQHYLRHANPATTAKTYVHLDRVRAVADVQNRMADPMDSE